jgi:disulfide bond formation protein DsbB
MKLFSASFLEKVRPYQPWIQYGIFLLSLVSLLGSMYYSTFGDPVANLISGSLFGLGAGFIPCQLCWFARILMYPIVPISTVGILKNDRRFTDYVLPLVIPGIFLETYHYALQMFPIENVFGCTLANPCNALQVAYFGFITIPLLCLIAFIIIFLLSLLNMQLELTAKQK